MTVERVTPSSLPDWLLGRGRLFVTTTEIAELTGLSGAAVPVHLHRARAANKIVSVTKGGWVPVPLVYRESGAPPPMHYVDYLMRYLGHPYYVGFLSAARIHGASHQVPMVLQIVTPALLRDRRVGAHRLQFVRRSDAASRAVQEHDTDDGPVTISTPETTVLDLVDAPERGAGLDNVGLGGRCAWISPNRCAANRVATRPHGQRGRLRHRPRHTQATDRRR